MRSPGGDHSAFQDCGRTSIDQITKRRLWRRPDRILYHRFITEIACDARMLGPASGQFSRTNMLADVRRQAGLKFQGRARLLKVIAGNHELPLLATRRRRDSQGNERGSKHNGKPEGGIRFHLRSSAAARHSDLRPGSVQARVLRYGLGSTFLRLRPGRAWTTPGRPAARPAWARLGARPATASPHAP